MRFVMLVTASVLLVGGCTVPIAGIARPATGVQVGATAEGAAADGAAAEGSAVAPPPGTFGDQQGRFALVPPAGWAVDTSGASGTAALFLKPKADSSRAGDFTANLNVLVVPSGTDLPSTVSAARVEVASVSGYQSQRDEPFTLVDGTPGHVLGGRFDDPAGFVLRNVQLFAVRGDRTVVVTGTALADTWDQYAATFDAALHTVQLAAPPAGSPGLAE